MVGSRRRANDIFARIEHSGLLHFEKVPPPACMPYKWERSSMARNEGIDRTSVRNVNLTAAKIGNVQRHNKREKESYANQDIIPERRL